MDDFEFDVSGARVVSINNRKPVHNPLNRPPVHYAKPIAAFAGFLLLTVGGWFLFRATASEYIALHTELSPTACTILFTAVLGVLYLCLICKRSLIWLIHCYQHYAPDRVRLKCVFEPSCSEYMILCIQKFGVIRGVPKGVHRLLRCHPPNGGADYP